MRYRNAAVVLPPDLLKRLQGYHEGLLWVPKVGKDFYRHRNKKIFRLRRKGMSIAAIAREIGLSRRQVIRILSHPKGHGDTNI